MTLRIAAVLIGDPQIARVYETDEFAAFPIQQGVRTLRIGGRRPFFGEPRCDVRASFGLQPFRRVLGRSGGCRSGLIPAVAIDTRQRNLAIVNVFDSVVTTQAPRAPRQSEGRGGLPLRRLRTQEETQDNDHLQRRHRDLCSAPHSNTPPSGVEIRNAERPRRDRIRRRYRGSLGPQAGTSIPRRSRCFRSAAAVTEPRIRYPDQYSCQSARSRVPAKSARSDRTASSSSWRRIESLV